MARATGALPLRASGNCARRASPDRRARAVPRRLHAVADGDRGGDHSCCSPAASGCAASTGSRWRRSRSPRSAFSTPAAPRLRLRAALSPLRRRRAVGRHGAGAFCRSSSPGRPTSARMRSAALFGKTQAHSVGESGKDGRRRGGRPAVAAMLDLPGCTCASSCMPYAQLGLTIQGAVALRDRRSASRRRSATSSSRCSSAKPA